MKRTDWFNEGAGFFAFPQTEWDDIVGQQFKREATYPYPCLKPCTRCSSTRARIGRGKGPHACSIFCLDCGEPGWLSERACRRVRRVTRKPKRR
jgi:hypothetical protein